MSIRAALVEDNPTLRKRFAEQFKLFTDIQLVFSSASGEEAIRRLKKLPPSKLPHVVLMDIELPKQSGIETTKELKDLFPDIDVMMVTVFEDEAKIFQSIQAGASGYLLKDESLNNIEQAIKELANGGAPISQSIARTVLSFIKDKTPESRTPHSDDLKALLTDREVELLSVSAPSRHIFDHEENDLGEVTHCRDTAEPCPSDDSVVLRADDIPFGVFRSLLLIPACPFAKFVSPRPRPQSIRLSRESGTEP